MPDSLLLIVAKVPAPHWAQEASPASDTYPGAHATHETLDDDPSTLLVDLPAGQDTQTWVSSIVVV